MSTAPNPYEPPQEPVEAAIVARDPGLQRDGDKYAIEFDIAIADLVAFALIRSLNSPVSRRSFYVGWLGATFLIAVLSSLPLLAAKSLDLDTLMISVIGWFLALLFFAIYPLRYRSILQRNISRMYAEGRNTSVCGAWRVVVSPEKLSVFTPLVEGHYQWLAVEKVERVDAGLYVYITALSAVTIPARAFRGVEEVDELEEVLLRYSQGAQIAGNQRTL